MNRKLLIVTTVAGTVSAFLFPFADHFRSHGWTVDAVASGIEDSSTCAPHFDSTWDIGWSRNPLDPANLRAIKTIRSIAEHGRYDLVHVHTPVAGFITRLALRELRRRRGVRVVYTAHGFHSHREGRVLANAVYCGLERLSGSWTDALVVINREDYQYAEKHRLVGYGGLYYVPGIGVDLEYYSRENASSDAINAVRAEMNICPEDRLFLMVADFAPGKRHLDAVRAFRLASEPGLHLAFAGAGRGMEKVSALVSELGLTQNVHFLGDRGDVPVLLASSVALVLPSAREGLPRSVLEAMAFGTPVIGSRIRGTTELLENGCGLLVDLGDTRGLSSAMRRVIHNPAEAERMARAARSRVQRYTLPRIVALHDEMYCQVLSPPNSAHTFRSPSSARKE